MENMRYNSIVKMRSHFS